MNKSSSNLIREQNAEIKLEDKKKELPAFMNLFIEHLKASRSSSTTFEYVNDISKFFEYLIENYYSNKQVSQLDHLTLATVTDTQITTYLSKFSRSSYNRNLSSLRMLFGYLADQQLIESNPCKLLSNMSISSEVSDIVHIDDNEILSKVDEAYTTLYTIYEQSVKPPSHKIYSELRDLALITLFMETGIKMSECKLLNVEDVNLENQYIKVKRHNQPTLLPMSAHLQQIMTLYMEDRKRFDVKDEKALFLNSSRHRLMNIGELLKALSLNENGITTHTLRKYFALKQANNNASIDTISKLLGCQSKDLVDKTYFKRN